MNGLLMPNPPIVSTFKNEIRIIKRTLRFTRLYLRSIILSGLLLLLFSGLNALQPWLIKEIIDKVFVENQKQMLGLLLAVLLLVVLFKNVFDRSHKYITNTIQLSTSRDIQNRFLKTMLERSHVGFYEKKRIGDFISYIMNDIVNMQGINNILVGPLMREPFQLIGLLGLLLYLNWELTLISLSLFIAVYFLIIRFRARIRKMSDAILETRANLFSFLQEKFYGIRVIKAFGLEEHEMKSFENENERFIEDNMAINKQMLILSPAIEIIGVLGVIIITVYLAKTGATTGTFTAFIAGLTMLYKPMKSIGNAYLSLQPCVAAAKRIYEIWDEAESDQKHDTVSGIELDAPIEEIRIDGLYFKYDGIHPVLEDISLHMRKGEIVCITGESGIGKTTLIDLLMRFYPYRKGSISVNGEELRDLDAKTFRNRIGLAAQECFLFNDSIRNNIAYGKRDCTEEEIISASQWSCSLDFIEAMENQFDTIIGDHGVQLSGGEKQRMSLARSFVRDPDVLILDEAMSSIDVETENKILENVKRLSEKKIILIISHRKNTLKIAGRIYRMEKHRLIEVT